MLLCQGGISDHLETDSYTPLSGVAPRDAQISSAFPKFKGTVGMGFCFVLLSSEENKITNNINKLYIVDLIGYFISI